MSIKFMPILYSFLGMLCLISKVQAQDRLVLSNGSLHFEWEKSENGYQLVYGAVTGNSDTLTLQAPKGAYTVLFAREKPGNQPALNAVGSHAASFPDKKYGHIYNAWKSSLSAVPLQLAGTAVDFYPDRATQKNKREVHFFSQTPQLRLESTWSLHPEYAHDILVEITLTAKQEGYFSIATPTLTSTSEDQLAWGMIPGQFQGNKLEEDLVLSYGYGQGIPDRPVMVRERATGTLSPLIHNKKGLTLAVIPEPGYGRDPWQTNQNTHKQWKLGFALMNHRHELSPTVFYPVLGETGSKMAAGESRTFRFRYTLQNEDWYTVYQHAIQDVYRFDEVLDLKQAEQSLSARVLAMSDYLRDDSTSMWNVQSFEGLKIGAQDYLSSVYEADGDAMKNSDYGAMWMLATIMNDTVLKKERLPYARNFKIAQQETDPGFFKGAARGQYFLHKTKRFVEEWGNYVEPVGSTYYVMLDMGNMLLFNPGDTLLRARLRLGADRLLDWQHADGHWEVAYDPQTLQPLFTELQDLRPTFYGLLVAYRMLGDEKYLRGACLGADWIIEHAVNRGAFLGVCGDFRFIPDFATGQIAQGLLDLYALTGQEKYRDAAIQTARLYTTSVYTHPIPNRRKKQVNGIIREDWEITQVGSRFEQGGLLGSANRNGPILLASHAGMFVRMFSLTGDSLFIDMARAAAWGQDAFVNPDTRVASYYWDKMNAGVGRYPHHAWWQVGWIMDYLVSEVHLRSGGKIDFPRGFMTPKVGPHQPYGFSAGNLYGKPVELILPEDLLGVSNPGIDFLGGIDRSSKVLYIMLLNNSSRSQDAQIRLNDHAVFPETSIRKIEWLDAGGELRGEIPLGRDIELHSAGYGLNTLKITYK